MNTILFLAGMTVLLGIGMLIGSGLHTRSVDQQYRRLAQRVRHLNAREAALDARSHSAAICGSCPLELHQGALLVGGRPLSVDEDWATCRRARHDEHFLTFLAPDLLHDLNPQ